MMRVTTIVHTTPGNSGGADQERAPSHPGRALRAMKLLRRKVLAAANGAMGQRFKRSTAPATVDIELTAIHTYAHFIAKHPDMPEDHRQRFLAKIVRSCEEIGEAFPWACREPVCKEQEP